MRDPLPHQMAVGAGMIKPKYPAAPRAWVTNFDQRPQAPAAAPIPRVSAGVQRDFSATYPGQERFRRIERLGSLLASAGLGYSYATKEDVQQEEEEAPRLSSPDDLTKNEPEPEERKDLKPEPSGFIGPTVPAGGARKSGLGGFGQSRFRADVANLRSTQPPSQSRANKRSKKKN